VVGCVRDYAGGNARDVGSDPRTTTTYDRQRQNFDRHVASVVVVFVVGCSASEITTTTGQGF
jgi:hypothetical protein